MILCSKSPSPKKDGGAVLFLENEAHNLHYVFERWFPKIAFISSGYHPIQWQCLTTAKAKQIRTDSAHNNHRNRSCKFPNKSPMVSNERQLKTFTEEAQVFTKRNLLLASFLIICGKVLWNRSPSRHCMLNTSIYWGIFDFSSNVISAQSSGLPQFDVQLCAQIISIKITRC